MKFNYKITYIDYSDSKVTIRYWCEGMTSYNGFTKVLDFDIKTIENITEEEFDKRVYTYVKDEFIILLSKYEDYKNGKYNILEKIARSARSIDVV